MCRRLDFIHGGAALRNWQNVRALAKLGPVDVVSVGPQEHPRVLPEVRHFESFPRIEKNVRSSIFNGFSRKSWVLAADSHPMICTHVSTAAEAWINERLKSCTYNVALIEELALVPYLSNVKGKVGFTIFDAHNVESALHRDIGAATGRKTGRLVFWKREFLDRRLQAVERQHVSGFDLVWTCSEVDNEGFNNLLENRVPCDVIPNTIDVNAYRQQGQVSECDDWSTHPLTLVYLGSYSYEPNEQAALTLLQEILPTLASKGINVRLILIGAGVTPAMRAIADGDQRVTITGRVDSVLPFLKQPCLVTLPIALGSGTRLKILEAFAANRPVISTSKGVEGIDGVDGVHLLVRESAEEIARAAIRLWDDTELRENLCRNALQLVNNQYSHDEAARLVRQSLIRAGLMKNAREELEFPVGCKTVNGMSDAG